MAHPRRVIPGETYLITRRCARRAFRLSPCADTNRIFLYCLAFAAKRTGVAIHAACVMSNHHHLVVTDVRGVLPEFLRELHRLTAKAINASQGQWENLWAAEPCNAVRLVTDEDVEDKIAYVVTNPVAAGLVERPEIWPGIVLWGDRTIQVERPESYFRGEGACPGSLELRIHRPRSLSAGAWDAPRSWSEKVGELVSAKVSAAHRVLRHAGRRFLGRAEVQAVSFGQRGQSYERRFGRVPTFAARAVHVREELRRIEREFRRRYRGAFERWRGGARDEVFPEGTWAMVVVHAAASGRHEPHEPNLVRVLPETREGADRAG